METPLQEKLGIVATQMGKIGIGAGVLTFLGLLIRYIVDVANSNPQGTEVAMNIVTFFITAVTVII